MQSISSRNKVNQQNISQETLGRLYAVSVTLNEIRQLMQYNTTDALITLVSNSLNRNQEVMNTILTEIGELGEDN